MDEQHDEQRTVLITGGNRGIGAAIARAFVAAGHRVAVVCRSGEGPEGTLTVHADVTDADGLAAAARQVAAQLGPIGVVVANAGITADKLMMRMDDADFSRVIDTNLTGAFRTVRPCLTGMIRARWGRIILISSVAGLLGNAGQVNYAAAKSGLIGMARSISRELGGRGITANVIAPGFIETDMTAQLNAEQRAAALDRVPAGRYGTAADVAAAAVWLAGDGASYVTGAVIPVDGGMSMGH
ncbi:MAG: 3-oxoacyl-ACP reductase FabG [Pseudoclavibacter sp.]